MANKRPKPEKIVSKLRQDETLMRQKGMSCLDAIREIGVVEQTHYHCRNHYGKCAKINQKNKKTE